MHLKIHTYLTTLAVYKMHIHIWNTICSIYWSELVSRCTPSNLIQEVAWGVQMASGISLDTPVPGLRPRKWFEIKDEHHTKWAKVRS